MNWERDEPVSMPDAQIVEDFEEGRRAIQRLMARQLRPLAQIDRRRTWTTEGQLSTPSWLVERYRMSWSATREQVRTARALEQMPRTAEAQRVHSVGELRRVVAYWRDAVDAAHGMDPTERTWNARYLHASPILEGMVRVDGNLDPRRVRRC
jgi:hypothetical protein